MNRNSTWRGSLVSVSWIFHLQVYPEESPCFGGSMGLVIVPFRRVTFVWHPATEKSCKWLITFNSTVLFLLYITGITKLNLSKKFGIDRQWIVSEIIKTSWNLWCPGWTLYKTITKTYIFIPFFKNNSDLKLIQKLYLKSTEVKRMILMAESTFFLV